jgi:glutaredoxin
MLDALRSTLYRAITTPVGDSLAPLRVPKDLARRINRVLGQPLASAQDLSKRRAARIRLATLRSTGEKIAVVREPAPVMVYFEKDRNSRELERAEEVLKARNIAYRLLDVAGDEAAMAFVTREAKCKEDDLPIVFVGGKVVGGFRKLVEFDVSGELVKSVFGPTVPS